MVDGLGNSSNVNQTTNVSRTNSNSGVEKNTSNASVKNAAGENDLATVADSTKTKFDELIENGTLKRQSWLFVQLNSYNYVCDGSKTLGEIKAELGLADGVLSKRNSQYIEKASKGLDTSKDHYLDDIKPSKGTELKLNITDFPMQNVTFQDDDGNNIEGFKKSVDGAMYYIIQSGDTVSELEQTFKAKCFKDYNMKSVVEGLNYHSSQVWANKEAGVLSVGEEIPMPEKNWFQKLIS